MDASLIISLIAIVISATSLLLGLFNANRDRGNVRALSELFYDAIAADSDAPILRIKVVNAGRRPVVLTNIVKKSESTEWSSPLVYPDTAGIIPSMEHVMAQHTSVRLAEGEVFEFIIRHDDYGEFHALIDDNVCTAENFLIEDVLGRRYKVKNAKQNLHRLISYEAKLLE